MFVPAHGQLVSGRIFDSLEFTARNPPIQQKNVKDARGREYSVWHIDPLVVARWTALEHMLTALTQFFTSQPYPLHTEHPPQPSKYYLPEAQFAVRKDAVQVVLRVRWAFVVYMGFLSGLAAYTDPKALSVFNKQSLWYQISDAIHSAFEHTWIFWAAPVRRVGALVDVSIKQSWWERDMLKRVLHNSEVPVWLSFGTRLPEQLADEQLSEFSPTRAQVSESIVDL